jgi:hypothetical protein
MARDALDGLVEVLAHEEGLNPAESAAAVLIFLALLLLVSGVPRD